MKDLSIPEFEQEVENVTKSSNCLTQPWPVTLRKIQAGETAEAFFIARETRETPYCNPCRIEDAVPAPNTINRPLSNAEKALALQQGCMFREEGNIATYRSRRTESGIIVEEVNDTFGDFMQGVVVDEIEKHLVVRRSFMNRSYAATMPLEAITILLKEPCRKN